VKQYAEQLQQGNIVQFRPRGNSMFPKISSGDLVTISPQFDKLEKGDVVLCKVKGQYYVHLIKAVRISKSCTQYQIGNNHGRINGWTSNVFGKVVRIEKERK
jgi:SOS-response transcriptional repressor LexA